MSIKPWKTVENQSILPEEQYIRHTKPLPIELLCLAVSFLPHMSKPSAAMISTGSIHEKSVLNYSITKASGDEFLIETNENKKETNAMANNK